jgi:hypothetical protein
MKLIDPKDITIKTGNKKSGKKSWLKVNKNMLYINRGRSRSYWLLNKSKPKMSFDDKNLTLRVSSNKIKFKKSKRYNSVKSILKKDLKK